MFLKRQAVLSLAVVIVAAVACAAPNAKNTMKKYVQRLRPSASSLVDPKMTTATWGPKRTKPVYEGAFQVDLVLVTFADCARLDAQTVRNALDHIKGDDYTLENYFDDYSQLTTYPVLAAYPSVYVAPKPFGHYCHWDYKSNRIGWKKEDEGLARLSQLRKDAYSFVQSKGKGFKKGAITMFVYSRDLDRRKIEPLLRSAYPKPKEPGKADPIAEYGPTIDWRDCFWADRQPCVMWPTDGRAVAHALGHELGSPDYDHCDEFFDGVPGTPSLPWGHGPTGMAFDRVIYNAFVPPATYPVLKEDGVYTLDPRQARISKITGYEEPKLGYFIPSSHPNYMFCVEYVHDERLPVGTPGAEGLLVHVINVTLRSPSMGPPDVCYTYRKGDPYMKGLEGGEAYLRPGDSFTMKTDPAARIPPLIPGGIEITDIKEKDDKCSFRLKFTNPNLTAKELKDALLPKIRLLSVNEVLPTSVRPTCDVIYRGEPLLTEYGFVWGEDKNPTVLKNCFPLFHRDRYDARILDLKPGTTYFVRAYAKNEKGVTYSEEEIKVDTPTTVKAVPSLITDRFIGNDYINGFAGGIDPVDLYYNSINPVIALLSLGVYYGVQPGGVEKGPQSAKIRKVHTNPAEVRPPFRMEEFETFFKEMRGLAERAGLGAKRFGKPLIWQKTCARELKAKGRTMFVSAKDASAFDSHRSEIRSWLNKSQPVLLIRENRFMPDVTHVVFPLDIAIIDGYDADGNWHVVYPMGNDRGTKTTSGYYPTGELYVSVTDALLLFYRP